MVPTLVFVETFSSGMFEILLQFEVSIQERISWKVFRIPKYLLKVKKEKYCSNFLKSDSFPLIWYVYCFCYPL